MRKHKNEAKVKVRVESGNKMESKGKIGRIAILLCYERTIGKHFFQFPFPFHHAPLTKNAICVLSMNTGRKAQPMEKHNLRYKWKWWILQIGKFAMPTRFRFIYERQWKEHSKFQHIWKRLPKIDDIPQECERRRERCDKCAATSDLRIE